MASMSDVPLSFSEETEKQTEKPLGEEDMKDVLNYLNGLAYKWKFIGVQLGLPIGRLDAIGSTETDLEGKLLEMVKAWLQGNYDEDKCGKPTWSRLASAVDSTNKAAARRIKKEKSDPTAIPVSKSYEDISSSVTSNHSPSMYRQSHLRSESGFPNYERSTRVENIPDDPPSSSFFCFPWRRKSKRHSNRSSIPVFEDTSAGIPSTLLTKATNPRRSIINHPSYRGVITGDQAQAFLFHQEGKCYLMRYSKSQNCYVLSVKYTKGSGRAKVHNFKVMDGGDKFWVDGDDRVVEFQTLQELLEHYTDNPLTHDADSTIGNICTATR